MFRESGDGVPDYARDDYNAIGEDRRDTVDQRRGEQVADLDDKLEETEEQLLGKLKELIANEPDPEKQADLQRTLDWHSGRMKQ